MQSMIIRSRRIALPRTGEASHGCSWGADDTRLILALASPPNQRTEPLHSQATKSGEMQGVLLLARELPVLVLYGCPGANCVVEDELQ